MTSAATPGPRAGARLASVSGARPPTAPMAMREKLRGLLRRDDDPSTDGDVDQPAAVAEQPTPVAPPRFVVVGTGRSGTGFIASALTRAGVETGHETWWGPRADHGRELVGDASWCATFELDGYEGRVFHQVRDPLKVLRSAAALEVAEHRRDNDWYRYRTTRQEFTGDPVVDALLLVARWVREAERRAEWTWRLEDVDADLLVEVGARVGVPVAAEAAAAALATDRRNEKRDEKRETYDFGWDDLPDLAVTERVRAHASRYGYL